MSDKTNTNPTTILSQNPSFNAVLAKHGIVPSDIIAPVPEVATKSNFDEVCVLNTPVYGPDGTVVKNMIGHSGPLMYLGTEEYSQATRESFKTKYDDYIGFRVYTVYHPTKGELVLTHGIPKTGPTDLMLHIAKLEKGNLFQVGSFPTSNGNRTFRPVPVQSS